LPIENKTIFIIFIGAIGCKSPIPVGYFWWWCGDGNIL